MSASGNTEKSILVIHYTFYIFFSFTIDKMMYIPTCYVVCCRLPIYFIYIDFGILEENFLVL